MTVINLAIFFCAVSVITFIFVLIYKQRHNTIEITKLKNTINQLESENDVLNKSICKYEEKVKKFRKYFLARQAEKEHLYKEKKKFEKFSASNIVTQLDSFEVLKFSADIFGVPRSKVFSYLVDTYSYCHGIDVIRQDCYTFLNRHKGMRTEFFF